MYSYWDLYLFIYNIYIYIYTYLFTHGWKTEGLTSDHGAVIGKPRNGDKNQSASQVHSYVDEFTVYCVHVHLYGYYSPISSFAYHGCTYFMWIFWCVNTYDFPHLAWTSMTASCCLVITSHVSNVSGMASHSHIFSAAYIHCRGTSIIYISNIDLCIYIWKYRMIVVP